MKATCMRCIRRRRTEGSGGRRLQLVSASQADEVAFYKSFPWRWFCTFTFPRRLRNGDEEARYRWKSFIDDLERKHGDTIGRLVAEESRHSFGVLSGIRLHYHALFASDHAVSPSLIRTLWKMHAGNGMSLADIRAYNPRRNAVAYCLKLHGSHHGQIEIHNLDIYCPTRPTNWDRNSKSRRRWRRQYS